jgi:hypothetical protein
MMDVNSLSVAEASGRLQHTRTNICSEGMRLSKSHDQVDSLLSEQTPDDVVGAIFAFSEEPLFSTDRQMLQAFFFGLAQDERFAPLVGDFEFTDKRDLYPFSRVLEASLGRLQMGKVIYARNPDYDNYGMDEAARTRMKELADEVFSGDEQELLREAARELVRHKQEWDEIAKSQQRPPAES